MQEQYAINLFLCACVYVCMCVLCVCCVSIMETSLPRGRQENIDLSWE